MSFSLELEKAGPICDGYVPIHQVAGFECDCCKDDLPHHPLVHHDAYTRERAKKDNFPFLCGCFSYSLSTFYTMADGRWQVCDLCLQSCCHLWKTLNIWKYSLLVFFSSPCQDKCRCNHFSKACFLLSSPRDSIKMSEFQKKGECLVMFL